VYTFYTIFNLGPPVGENGARNSESDVEIDVDGPDNTNSMVFNHFDATNVRKRTVSAHPFILNLKPSVLL
jgi:hypothetical protein